MKLWRSLKFAARQKYICTGSHEAQNSEMKMLRKSILEGAASFKEEKLMADLLRSYLVLRMAQNDFFADNAYKIFSGAKRLLGPALFQAVFHPTIYSNFIAGSSKDEILRCALKFHRSGLSPLISPMLEDNPDCDSSSEEVYERNYQTVSSAIDICGSLPENPYQAPKTVAIKLTAFMPASLLRELTLTLGNSEEISCESVRNLSYFLQNGKLSFEERFNSNLISSLDSVAPKLRKLGEVCTEKNVSLFIDAESSQLQPGVRLMTLALAYAHNKESGLFWNTYQCYLKRTEAQIIHDIDLAKKLGFRWAGKIVRGAYMDYERNRARELNVSCPVHDTYEDTNNAYNRTLEYVLGKKHKNEQQIDFILATHNRESVLKACELTYNLDKNLKETINFGQISGMGEALSYGLANSGFRLYKLIPTGTVDEVLPWLARRMSENRSGMISADLDRQLIKKEITRRFKIKMNITE